ncbi:MAG: NAD-dependent epimerase/dehydratase family protein, partial [Dehalococcoidia bacterium]
MTRAVLVTGGAGFIGRHLVAALVARGDRVTVMDNLFRGDRPTVPAEARFLEADIRDVAALAEVLAGHELVYHLAAQSNVMGAVQDSDYSFTTNVLGTLNVVREAGRAGVRRVVFSSSREVYGEPGRLPVDESALIFPKNAYGASKAAGEAYLSAAGTFGVAEAVALRFANVYGPGDRDRVIPRWVEAAANGEPLTVYGGEQVIDFVHVKVAVSALLAAAACAPGLVANVGSGQGTPILELARRVVAASTSRASVEIAPARGPEVVRFVADVGRMRAELGVQPPADPLEHLEALVREARRPKAALTR